MTFLDLLVGAVTAVLTFFNGVAYFVGRVQFAALLSNSMESSDGVSKSKSSRNGEPCNVELVLRMTKNTQKAILVAYMFVFVLAVLLVPFAFDWKHYDFPGGLGAYAILTHYMFLFLALLKSSIYMYTHGIFKQCTVNSN